MTPRSMFPRARPTKAVTPRKRQPKAKIHVFIWDATSDWRGIPYCAVATCGQPRDSPVHDLTQTPAAASEIDARKLGEGK